MQLYCPGCRAAFAGTTHCPKCGGRLLAPQESFVLSGSINKAPPEPEEATFGGRAVVGSAVGLALWFGGRELATAFGYERELTANLLDGGILAFGLLLAAAVVGGLIAGVGRDDGATLGATAGAAVAALPLLMAAYDANGVPPGVPGVALGTLLAFAAAVLAGLVGSRVWPPPTALPQATASSHGSSLARLAEEEVAKRTTRPTAWGRIVVATLIAVAGVMLTDFIRVGLYKGSLGLMPVAGAKQSPYIGFQIAVAFVAVAGVVSSISTGAGLRHGLFTGLIAAAGVFAASWNQPDHTFPSIEGAYLTFDQTPEAVTSPRGAIRIFGGMIAVATAGGWVGGTLFPPLAPYWRRAKRLQQQS